MKKYDDDSSSANQMNKDQKCICIQRMPVVSPYHPNCGRNTKNTQPSSIGCK